MQWKTSSLLGNNRPKTRITENNRVYISTYLDASVLPTYQPPNVFPTATAV